MFALGLEAEVIYHPVRQHVQLMVAYLQLILIATRGHRAYTSAELVTIFQGAGRQFFIHLEQVTRFTENRRVFRAQSRHDKNPERFPAPVPFCPPTRFTYSIFGVIVCIREYLHVYKLIVYVYFNTYTNFLGIQMKLTPCRRTTIAHGVVWVCSSIPEKAYLMPWYMHPNLWKREDTMVRFVALCRRCHTR